MKNKIMFLIFGILLLVSLSNISAVEYFQQKYFIGNDTTQIHSLLFWDYSTIQDNVKSGNQLETYVWYNIYPNAWNNDNPDYLVDYCNLTISVFRGLQNGTTILYNKTFTTEDNPNGKYFVDLNKGDGYFVDVYCKFENNRPALLELPATFSIVTPTWECKECQYYKWAVLEQNIEKTKTIQENSLDVMSYIKQFVSLNYEILISVFWLILIFLVFIGTSLIFVGIYWVYLFLRNIGRKNF